MFGCPRGAVHRVSGLWERMVRWRDRCVSGPVLFSDVDGLQVSRERGPRPGDVGGICWGSADSLGQRSCTTSWAAKASSYLSGVRCRSRAV